MPLILAKDICYSIKKTTILQNINLEINKGEIICLLGPSGSGKTTLLRNLIGELIPTSGEVLFEGSGIPCAKLHKELGYMLQADTIYEDLTACDNLQYFASLYNIKNAAVRIKEILDWIELSAHSNKLVAKFSGGMKRRLSLAIALLHKPKLLVLDEPTVGIDPILREKFWNHFTELKQLGHAIIITTHVMSDADRCDNLIIIKEGKITAKNTPEELKKLYQASSMEDLYIKASS